MHLMIEPLIEMALLEQQIVIDTFVDNEMVIHIRMVIGDALVNDVELMDNVVVTFFEMSVVVMVLVDVMNWLAVVQQYLDLKYICHYHYNELEKIPLYYSILLQQHFKWRFILAEVLSSNRCTILMGKTEQL